MIITVRGRAESRGEARPINGESDALLNCSDRIFVIFMCTCLTFSSVWEFGSLAW